MPVSPFNARRREQRALALFDRSHAAMFILDDERRFLDANDAAGRLLGLPREELVGRSADDLIPADRFDTYLDIWRALQAEGGQTGEFTIVRPDGEDLEIEYSAVANVMPGRHLSIVLPAGADDGAARAARRSRPALTPREREVLGLVAQGLTTDAIARELVVSAETVRTHVRNALESLGARTRAHAIAIAIERDLLDP